MKFTNKFALIALMFVSFNSIFSIGWNSTPNQRNLEEERKKYFAYKNGILREAFLKSEEHDKKIDPDLLATVRNYHRHNPLPDSTNFAATLKPGQDLARTIYAGLGETRQWGVGHYRAADCAGFVVNGEDHTQDRIMLIVRPNGKFALAGGFVDATETSRDAAARECNEETNMKADILGHVVTVDTPGRDKRAPVSTDVFYALLTGTPKPTNEALTIVFKTEAECNAIPDDKWAFDHQELVKMAWPYHRQYTIVSAMSETKDLSKADFESIVAVLVQFMEQRRAQ